jgi:hypothetical protein
MLDDSAEKESTMVSVKLESPKEPKMEDFSPSSYAGKAVMQALKSGDEANFCKALKAFVKIVYMECEQEEDSKEEYKSHF